jgi:hypothetical protein
LVAPQRGLSAQVKSKSKAQTRRGESLLGLAHTNAGVYTIVKMCSIPHLRSNYDGANRADFGSTNQFVYIFVKCMFMLFGISALCR